MFTGMEYIFLPEKLPDSETRDMKRCMGAKMRVAVVAGKLPTEMFFRQSGKVLCPRWADVSGIGLWVQVVMR